MTRGLVVLFVALQLLDLATWAQAPQLEANVARFLPPLAVVIGKLSGIALALAVVLRLRPYPRLEALALGIGIAIGALGVGANLATLSMLAS